jgi:DNA-binding NarL/FixJ family response regulator
MGPGESHGSLQGKAKVLVVDDHPIVRKGLTQLLNQEADLAVCAEAEDAPGALAAIEDAKPDVALIDIALPETDGIELIKRIKENYPGLPVLALSMHPESLYAARVLRAGGQGYIMKQEAPEKVVLALRKVLHGEIYLSDAMTTRLLRTMARAPASAQASALDALSDRELQVFRLIGQGHATRRVAEMLHISVKTIESYRENIKEKLGLKDGAELVHHAIQWVHCGDMQSEGSTSSHNT